jgi:hypothetical protein
VLRQQGQNGAARRVCGGLQYLGQAFADSFNRGVELNLWAASVSHSDE